MDNPVSRKLGIWALVAGVLSAFGSFMIYASSVFLDPPGWVRIPTMALFPVGLLASLLLGVQAIKSHGRLFAILGWTAAFAGVALFAYALVVLS